MEDEIREQGLSKMPALLLTARLSLSSLRLWVLRAILLVWAKAGRLKGAILASTFFGCFFVEAQHFELSPLAME